MTTRIEQRQKSDCTLCCYAMALGISYDDLAQRVGPAFMTLIAENGTTDQAEIALQTTLGLRPTVDFMELGIRPEWSSVKFAKNVLWGRRAIICVRSKNNFDGYHSLYWDGRELFDPSPKKTYGSLDDVEPMSITLFMERPQ